MQVRGSSAQTPTQTPTKPKADAAPGAREDKACWTVQRGFGLREQGLRPSRQSPFQGLWSSLVFTEQEGAGSGGGGGVGKGWWGPVSKRGAGGTQLRREGLGGFTRGVGLVELAGERGLWGQAGAEGPVGADRGRGWWGRGAGGAGGLRGRWGRGRGGGLTFRGAVVGVTLAVPPREVCEHPFSLLCLPHQREGLQESSRGQIRGTLSS